LVKFIINFGYNFNVGRLAHSIRSVTALPVTAMVGRGAYHGKWPGVSGVMAAKKWEWFYRCHWCFCGSHRPRYLSPCWERYNVFVARTAVLYIPDAIIRFYFVFTGRPRFRILSRDKINVNNHDRPQHSEY